jgi:hypothetical protein
MPLYARHCDRVEKRAIARRLARVAARTDACLEEVVRAAHAQR